MPFDADACRSGDAAARSRRADRGEMPMESTKVFARRSAGVSLASVTIAKRLEFG